MLSYKNINSKSRFIALIICFTLHNTIITNAAGTHATIESNQKIPRGDVYTLKQIESQHFHTTPMIMMGGSIKSKNFHISGNAQIDNLKTTKENIIINNISMIPQTSVSNI